jgi:3-oxoacyl-[acyl-carrier protein] reductase
MSSATTINEAATPPVALVTGGSTGIGLAICEDFLARGYQVLSLARRAPTIEHERLEPVLVDLLDREQTAKVMCDLTSRYAITTLVHNAGMIRENLLEDVSLDDLDALSTLHLGVAITLVQATLATMRERAYGRIVLMTTRAVVGLPKRTVYSATKAGMIGLTRTWSLELGGTGITVNAIAPGPIADTEMFDNTIPPGDPRIPALEKAIPVGRLGRPRDVARAVRFFTDPEGDFVTGQTLYVCGGASVASMSF